MSRSAWELARLDGIGQADLVRAGEVTPQELADAALTRIEQLDPRLGALVLQMGDLDAQLKSVEDVADGPLRGVPTLLKDIGTPYAGEEGRDGARHLPGPVADHDAELVARYRRAGLVFVGKSTTSEFGICNETTWPGPTHNPWDPTRSTGGSSAGAGAAVAAGLVPLAHGSDGGGSIRWPASWCGLFGLKPTRGRNPLGPDATEGPAGLVVAHMLTRSVRDSAAALDASHGPDVGGPFRCPPGPASYLADSQLDPPRLRIGFCEDAPDGQPVDQSCRAAVNDAAHLCSALGHYVETARPSYDVAALVAEFDALTWDANAARRDGLSASLGRALGEDDVEPLTWFLMQRGESRTASDHIRSLARLQRVSRDAAAYFNDYDIFLTPSNPSPAVLHEEITANRENCEAVWGRELGGGTFFLSANVTGHPAMTVPLYWTESGLPVGCQFMGSLGREDLLLRLARQLEASRPWSERWPGMVPVDAGSR